MGQAVRSDTTTRRGRSPGAFFVLVFLLTVPFVVVGEVSGAEIRPGIPLTGLAFVCPGIAAVLLTLRESGRAGVGALLRRACDPRVPHRAWYLPVLLLYPAVLAVSYLVLRLRGVDVPTPDIDAGETLMLAVVFFVGALGEELGWSGYVLEPLRERWGGLVAGLAVGAVWAVWHWVPLAQVHRPLDWIAWSTLGTIALRVIMVWLFDNSGRSVFAMVLFHMMINVGWQLFPVDGSHFDQPSTAVTLAVVAVLVAVGWGRRTVPG